MGGDIGEVAAAGLHGQVAALGRHHQHGDGGLRSPRERHHRAGELPALVWQDLRRLPQVLRSHVSTVPPGPQRGLVTSASDE